MVDSMKNSPHIIKSFITTEYAKSMVELINKFNLMEDHPFYNFKGIKMELDKIDPENKVNELIEIAKSYFEQNYSIPGRSILFSRSYGTAMYPGSWLDVHLDHYNSGREANFSYGDSLVCNLYLSEDYEGGELVFPEIGYEFKPQIGDAVFFPGFLLKHGVNHVKSGTRISLLNHFSLLSEEDSLDESISSMLRRTYG